MTLAPMVHWDTVLTVGVRIIFLLAIFAGVVGMLKNHEVDLFRQKGGLPLGQR